MTTREDSMRAGTVIQARAEVRCTDGDCGKLINMVINRGTGGPLVVVPARREGPARIVPLGLVDAEEAARARSGCAAPGRV